MMGDGLSVCRQLFSKKKELLSGISRGKWDEVNEIIGKGGE